MSGHLSPGGTPEIEGVPEDSIDAVVPVLIAEIGHAPPADLADHVDDDVDPAQLGDDPLDRALRVLRSPQVGLYGYRPASVRADLVRDSARALAVDVAAGDLRPGLGQAERARAAEPRPCARDERPSSRQAEV